MIINNSLGLDAFIIPFDAKKKRNLYVSHIIFDKYPPENVSVIDYTNSFQLDIEAIKKVIPTVNWIDAINEIMLKIC